MPPARGPALARDEDEDAALSDVVSSLQLHSEIAQLPLYELGALCARQQWLIAGRADQMPPPEYWTADDVGDGEDQCTPDQVDVLREDWFFWLMMAGRGAGKTRAGAEDAWWFGYRNPGSRIAVVAPTSNDCRKVCFEGESGLLAVIPPELVANWNRGEQVLTLTNGTMYQGYSAEEPDRLRGPQHHRAWCDELAAWRYLDDTLDNLMMGLRLGECPRIVATTTPRPIARLKEIVADRTTWVDTVSTYANLENLPRIFREKIIKRYEGTRLGRQELLAEILTDNPYALWQREQIDADRIKGAYSKGIIKTDDGRVITLVRVVVAVDPASGGVGEDSSKAGSSALADEGDEIGIIIIGLGDDGHAYVIGDATTQGTPGEWGRAAVVAYDQFFADRVIYEANQGGDMVRHTVQTAAKAMRDAGERGTDFVPLEAVWASKGKVTRAEPVSALYAQHRVHHLGTLPRLEDQQCEFTSNFDRKKMGYSPDRVDADVWGVTHLMLSDESGLNVQDYYRQEASRHAEARERMQTVGVVKSEHGFSSAQEGGRVALRPPNGESRAVGLTGHMYSVNPDGVMYVWPDDVEPLVRSGYQQVEDPS